MAEKFEIFRGTNNQYYFRLKAPNGEKILASEGYTTKVNCQTGVQSVKTHSPHDQNYTRLKAQNGQFYFTLKASNGQVIGVGENYATQQGMENGIAAVKTYAPSAPIVDLT